MKKLRELAQPLLSEWGTFLTTRIQVVIQKGKKHDPRFGPSFGWPQFWPEFWPEILKQNCHPELNFPTPGALGCRLPLLTAARVPNFVKRSSKFIPNLFKLMFLPTTAHPCIKTFHGGLLLPKFETRVQCTLAIIFTTKDEVDKAIAFLFPSQSLTDPFFYLRQSGRSRSA